ncbi:hypothetical protein [Aquimarina celericrescens]|uniref:DUF5648 domain-containing protein n=1 Tax=Aquimarina celericrescens TaxID=1964542 RepID=A0ABW5B116_9FLAO|nr:hypothetical protein [Aquimarina celericrescens]
MKTLKSITTLMLFWFVLIFSSCEQENINEPYLVNDNQIEENLTKSGANSPYNKNIIRTNDPGTQIFGYYNLFFTKSIGRFFFIGDHLNQRFQGFAFQVAFVERNPSSPLLPPNLRSIDPIKLYFLKNHAQTDMILTTDKNERRRLLNKSWIDVTNDIFYSQGVLYRSDTYISKTQVAGTVPLYRFNHTPTGRHFYTADANERTSVLASGQYVEEGKVGYVKLSSN